MAELTPPWPGAARRSRHGASVWCQTPAVAERLHITATTPSGFVAGDGRWPMLLDGILAWVDFRVMRGVPPGGRDRHAPSMPLMQLKASTGQWVWAATAAHWVDDAPIEVRPWGRRSDEAAHRLMAGHDGRINTSTGADKAQWRHDLVVLAGSVEWWAVGHADTVRSWLIDHVHHVGAKSRRGQGEVCRWEVESVGPVGDDPAWWIAHQGPGRPFHPCFTAIISHSGQTVQGSARPPYVHPNEVFGLGRRDWIQVLAPR